MSVAPQSQAFFESCYQQSPDPWCFATSAYELERYRCTLAALSRPSYRRVYEPGCSVGVLTQALAARCDALVATDLAPSAVALAQERCKDLSHVQIRQCDLADGPPAGLFDLIIFSEIGYYFSEEKLREVVRWLTVGLARGGEFVAVHWLGQSADHLLHGDRVHGILATTLGYAWIKGTRQAGFRMDSWRAP